MGQYVTLADQFHTEPNFIIKHVTQTERRWTMPYSLTYLTMFLSVSFNICLQTFDFKFEALKIYYHKL